VTTDSAAAKPANGGEVTTDSGGLKTTSEPTASTSEPYRELIETGLAQGRNAMSMWQQSFARPR
jgi:hypothetical protein